jgi:hypothetical protein
MTPRALRDRGAYRVSILWETDVSTLDVTCPTCGSNLKFRLEHAGNKGRCKWCGATFQIPDAPAPPPAPSDASASADESGSLLPPVDEGEDSASTAAALAAAIQTDDDDDDDDDESDSDKSASIPPEPWYYGFLDGYAKLTMTIGLIACLVVVCYGMLVCGGADPATGFSLIGLGVLCVILTLLATAPILLAVDAARNLRAMRYGVR